MGSWDSILLPNTPMSMGRLMANFQYSFIQTMMAKLDWLIKTIASTIFLNIYLGSQFSLWNLGLDIIKR